MRLRAVLEYVRIICVGIVGATLVLFLCNWAAEKWLRRHPELLMSSADRINENTRAIREKMIPADKAAEWYDIKSAAEIKPMWDEFYRAGAVFESYVHFRSRTLIGNYYGFTGDGYRLSREPGPWPPNPANFNVFFFGGSTSFGVGPYWATVASYLQDALNSQKTRSGKVYVYNFGRSGYISTQEQILFHRLISAGYRPNMVVFMDGLNDFCFHDGLPSSWQMLADHFDRTNAEYLRQVAGYGIVTRWEKAREFLQTLPLMRLTDALIDRSTSEAIPQYKGGQTEPDDKPQDEAALRGVIARYLDNMRQVKSVADTYGIIPVFVWQPIPTYKYNVKHHIFYPNRLGCHVNSRSGYPLMDALRAKRPLGDAFVWAADIQQDLNEPLYVDAFHYTAPMSKRIAALIAASIHQRRALESHRK